jgi:putative flippase GtrA
VTGDKAAIPGRRGLGVPESQASRVAAFTIVGIAGYVVQTALLWLLVGRLGLAVVPATLAATEAAVLHNFLWHLGWTWADRPAGPGAVAGRLVRFNLSNGGFSLVGGAAIMALLVDALGVHYLVANLAAVLVVSIANFLASDRLVFTRPGGPAAAAARHTTHKTTAM